jgi:molybdate transport system substrate-binding protein
VTVTFKIVAFLLAGTALQAAINVATASNLTEVAQVLGAQFEARTGIRVVFSYGSTAQLTTQIENGAPYDVFLAADAAHVEQLERRKLLQPHSRAVYATGVLVLWIPSAAPAVNNIKDLGSSSIRVIAVAKPELAPYGSAAIEALRRSGILEAVRSKIVYSDSINMAKQYGATGNADAVFTAWSLVKNAPGHVFQVDATLYRPITQELGLISASAHKTEAARFIEFVLGANGREILTSFGYR